MRLFYAVLRPRYLPLGETFLSEKPIMFLFVAIPLLSPTPLIIKRFTDQLANYRASHVEQEHVGREHVGQEHVEEELVEQEHVGQEYLGHEHHMGLEFIF